MPIAVVGPAKRYCEHEAHWRMLALAASLWQKHKLTKSS